jgi:hypothetical protein
MAMFGYNNNGKQCFLPGLCRDVISKKKKSRPTPPSLKRRPHFATPTCLGEN